MEAPAYLTPHLIRFPKLEAPDTEYIFVGENVQEALAFVLQRVFWRYYTPESILRGRHAHHRTEQVLIAVAGHIIVTTELVDGTIQIFRLEDPRVGLYVPPYAWHTIQYSSSAVQMVLAATSYHEADYIRDYSEFKRIWQLK